MMPGENLESGGAKPLQESPEISRERLGSAPETPERSKTETRAAAVDRTVTDLAKSQASQPPQSAPTKDQMLQAVERVLEDGLRDPFLGMTAQQRRTFRLAGEALAIRLRNLAGQDVRPNSIYVDVMSWLQQVPGANEFWLQQAGYIKTTKVIGRLSDAS